VNPIYTDMSTMECYDRFRYVNPLALQLNAGVMCRRPEFKLDADFSCKVLQKN